jgi:hypothetical protein
MKKYFKKRIEAIDWIANNVEDEGQFEVLREQLNFNFIYTGTYFVIKDQSQYEVVLLTNKDDQ